MSSRRLLIVVMVCAVGGLFAAPLPAPLGPGEEPMTMNGDAGRYGGRIVVALRAEPKTLNPAIALDQPSREVTGRMNADLLHINALTEESEPALAKSWKVSRDGLHYVLSLRHGLRFSDGHPLDADDVVFTFQVLLDEKVGSSQRDLLMIGGKPIRVRKIDEQKIEFDLAQPYAAAERLFDGIAILPRHLLEQPYREGKLAQAWTLNTAPSQIAGTGPFRLKEYVPGQRLVLERNPYYWKVDGHHQRLPYLDEIVFVFVSSEDAQVLQFEAGETDVINRLSADNYAVLQRDAAQRGFELVDLGPGLDYNFLFFNLNSKLPAGAADLSKHQQWFRDRNFREAISVAIDRAAIVRLVFRGRGTALWSTVTPANKLWLDSSIAQPPQSLDRAKALLRTAGFAWTRDGQLHDRDGNKVEFTLITSSSNAQRMQMATLIQDDLSHIGVKVQVVPLEFRSVLERIFQTHDYDAAILALGGGDVDPNSQINVWMSNGSSHLWDLDESKPATAWESEIDALMTQQLSMLDRRRRKRLYDQVQEIAARELPLVCLASPHLLVGAKTKVGNFRPAILDEPVLWNVEQLYIK